MARAALYVAPEDDVAHQETSISEPSRVLGNEKLLPRLSWAAKTLMRLSGAHTTRRMMLATSRSRSQWKPWVLLTHT